MDTLGMTRLGVAARSGDAKEVKRLLGTDDVLERDVYGNTAAHYAMARYMTTEDKSTDTFVMLCENVDIVRIPNKNRQFVADIANGETLKCTDAYECPCECCPSREITEFLDNRPVICLLLECKAYELPGISPLNKSILKMHGGIVDMLTERMPHEIGKKDIFGNNACHYAAYRDCKGTMDILVERSTDKTVMQAVNNMGQRPTDIVENGRLLISDGVTSAKRIYMVEPGCDHCSLSGRKVCQPCE